MTAVELEQDPGAYVSQVRHETAGRLETLLYDLEGKLAACMNGPVEIPRDGSAMVDAWSAIVHELGTYAHNFTVRGERMFVKSRRAGAIGGLGTASEAVGILVDTLDAYLDRYDPGSVNVNDALAGFCADLATIRGLRAQRGAILRDGLSDPRALADTELERAALTGPYGSAVGAVSSLLELDDRSDGLDAVDPVGLQEIAERLYVKRGTVDQWQWRGLLPKARWTVGGRPAWNFPDIMQWARETGREMNETARADLVEF